MKPRHGFLLLALAVILSVVALQFSSCCGGGNKTEKNVIKLHDTGYRMENVYGYTIKIVEFDGCEYLYGDWGNATVLTHKGNCKYCIQRNLN